MQQLLQQETRTGTLPVLVTINAQTLPQLSIADTVCVHIEEPSCTVNGSLGLRSEVPVHLSAIPIAAVKDAL